jgi:DNA (cytosine-5)-methyltransferase 1
MGGEGLGPRWDCKLAIDNHPGKIRSYIYNHGKDHVIYRDVAKLRLSDVHGPINLCLSSTPCQDVSIAGARAGLSGTRSSVFWSWWERVQALRANNCAFDEVVLENVPGLLSSNSGADIAAIRQAYETTGYDDEIVKIDAKHFVAQSRLRVFVIGVRRELGVNIASYVAKAIEALPQRNQSLADIVDPHLPCFPAAETAKILAMMTPKQLAKVEEARRVGEWVIGVFSKHTRIEAGVKVQRVEVRFDDIAYALRTAAGGSSRSGLIAVKGGLTRARLLSPRECARAMGLPDDYRLPLNANDAYDLIGDGVAPAVVRHLAAHVLEPILNATVSRKSDVARRGAESEKNPTTSGQGRSGPRRPPTGPRGLSPRLGPRVS